MKKIFMMSVLLLAANMAFAQKMKSLEEAFHYGDNAEKATDMIMEGAMIKAVMSGEKNDEAFENMMFEYIKEYADILEGAMHKDCEAQYDAQKCACFYQEVDLKELFLEIRKVELEKGSDKVEQLIQPYKESMIKKKMQCQVIE